MVHGCYSLVRAAIACAALAAGLATVPVEREKRKRERENGAATRDRLVMSGLVLIQACCAVPRRASPNGCCGQ